MFSDITVGAEYLESFLRPSIVPEEAVQVGSTLPNLPAMFGPVTINMINGEEMPVGFVATNAAAAVGGHNLPPQVLSAGGSILKAGRAVFFGGQLLLAAVSAQSSRRQLSSVSLCGASGCLTALLAQFRRRVTFFATIGTSHSPYIVADYGGYIKGAPEEVAAK